MKINFFGFLILIPLSIIGQPNFEIWNKHTEPLYYTIANSVQQVSRTPWHELRAGKWISKTIDISKPNTIALTIGSMPQEGQQVKAYTINPGKTIYIRIGLPAEKEKFKETIKNFLKRNSLEEDDYIIGPQVGPLLGFKGTTERGYSLDRNFSKSDITRSIVTYSPKE